MIDEFPPGPYYSVRWRDLPDEAEDPPRPHWAELNPVCIRICPLDRTEMQISIGRGLASDKRRDLEV